MVEVNGGLLEVDAGFVFGVALVVVALGAVVHLLQEGLVLLHHVGGGAAAAAETHRTMSAEDSEDLKYCRKAVFCNITI